MDKGSTDEAVPATQSVDDNPREMSVADVYDFYRQLRSCPVQHSDAHGGFFWLTRYDDVRAAARDWQRFSSGHKGVFHPADLSAGRLPALEMDAPEHRVWRKLYTESLTEEKLKAVEPRLVAITNGLIDEFAGAGECDLMKDFAEVLPVLGVCETIGLTGPSVARIRELAYEFTRANHDVELRRSVTQKIGALALEQILARRAEPRDDYLTHVAHAEIGGRQMDEAELSLFMVGFLVEGHETTTSAMGTLLFHTPSRPNLKERMLADDRVIAAAIEESVRLYPPFHAFHRTTTEDVSIGGVAIPADSTVRLCYASANRDPDVFDRPDDFDPDRPGNPHLGFGKGAACVPWRTTRPTGDQDRRQGAAAPASRHPCGGRQPRVGLRGWRARRPRCVSRSVYTGAVITGGEGRTRRSCAGGSFRLADAVGKQTSSLAMSEAPLAFEWSDYQ